MWAKQYIQFHKNSPRLFFFSCFFFFFPPHFLNRASIGMREVEVPDLGQNLKSPSSDPACYGPTWLKVFLWLFWCPWFAHNWLANQRKDYIFRVLFMLSLLTFQYTHTHIYLKKKETALWNFCCYCHVPSRLSLFVKLWQSLQLKDAINRAQSCGVLFLIYLSNGYVSLKVLNISQE